MGRLLIITSMVLLLSIIAFAQEENPGWVQETKTLIGKFAIRKAK